MASCFKFPPNHPQQNFHGLGRVGPTCWIYAEEPLLYVLPVVLFGVPVYVSKGHQRHEEKASCVRRIHLDLMPLVLIVGVLQ